ncbi:dynamin family protein [Vibrio metschnikovii]|uniref:dynamin family protein n=1 Tax=Vibrio metschnikovii TaxID=28172 RepID=UPI001C30C380|nr:dynamin family protein [Vibrio metschnikovii]
MKLKKQLEQLLPNIETLAKEQKFEAELKLAIKSNQQFKLRLPLVGAFSSGKSTLLNTLLDEKLLSVEVTPETCLPTEISYSEVEFIHLMTENQKVAELTRAQLKDQDYLLSLQKSKQLESAKVWLEIGLSHPVLERHKDLVLVDMPGWESGMSEHSLAIDNYIQSSGAYCIVIQATDGTIRQSIQQALTELKLFNKPIVLVITKADKINSDELPSVIKNITKAVIQYLGLSPLAVVTTTARKKHIDGFEESLTKVVEQSDIIYRNMVLTQFYDLFERMEKRLNILLNEENLTVDQVQSACDLIPEELAELKNQLKEVEQQVDQIIPLCVELTKENLVNNLKSQLSSLVTTMRNNGNIQNQVDNALRNAYLKTVEQDFKPKIKRQLTSLQTSGDIMPTNLNIENPISGKEHSKGTDYTSQLLSAFIAKIAWQFPVLKPFAPFIFAIASIFGSKLDQERQREQENEYYKQHILTTVIPQVMTQLQPVIQSSFNDMVLRVKQEITFETERNAADKQQALVELQKELSEAKKQDSIQKLKYKESLNQLTEIRTKLA